MQLTKLSKMSQTQINHKTELEKQITVLGNTKSNFIFKEI